MRDIRYWVSKVFALEQAEVRKKPEPKHSPSEQIKFYQEEEKPNPLYTSQKKGNGEKDHQREPGLSVRSGRSCRFKK